ncbi:MAG TPA: virginiamycin B lyase [Thermoanaerobaculia bacterium]|jgi:streptogramin lyase
MSRQWISTAVASLILAAPFAARGQTIDEFVVPTANAKPQCIVPGPDGNLWFTEGGARKIGKITPDGQITEYAVHSNSGGLSLDVQCLTTGPDGDIWFTTSALLHRGPLTEPRGKIGKMTTTGVVTVYPHEFEAELYAITPGPDGALWFTETTLFNENTIGRITTSGDFTEYPLPDPGALIAASGIVAGPDGRIWFTQAGAQEIGTITTDGETITSYPTPGFLPAGITVGPDGALWFTEGGTAIGLAQITTDGDVTQYDIPSVPANVVTGPDGALWLTEGNKIARWIKTGRNPEITELAVPTPGSAPDGIASGPDGNIWFTERTGNKVGRVNLIPPATCGTGRGHVRPVAPPEILTCVSQRP